MLSTQSGSRLRKKNKQAPWWPTNSSNLAKLSRPSPIKSKLKLTKAKILYLTKTVAMESHSQHRMILSRIWSITTRFSPPKWRAKGKFRCNCSKCLRSFRLRTWRKLQSKSKPPRSSSSILSWAKSSSKWVRSFRLISSRSSCFKSKHKPMVDRRTI